MLILPKQIFNTPFCDKIAFKSKKEKQNDFSFNINCNMSDAFTNQNSLLSGTQSEKIKAQLNDPKQKSIFCSTLVSLLATAASQLTEIMTEETANTYTVKENKTDTNINRKVSPDGDVLEVSISQGNVQPQETIALIPLQKHKGRLTLCEEELIATIDLATQKLDLNNAEINSLNELYNEFCGKNYKGYHSVDDVEPVSNKEITGNLIERLQVCKDKNTLKEIIEEFGIYAPIQISEQIESDFSDDAIEPEILKVIAPYKNIVASYKNLLKESNIISVRECQEYKKSQVDEFLKRLDNDEELVDIKTPFLKSLNKNYSSYLYNVAYVVNSNSDKNAKKVILEELIDKTIAPKTLTEWEKYKFRTERFSFNNFNSLISSDIKEENIEKLLKLKKDGCLISINVTNPENYTIKLPLKPVEKNFKTLNDVHQILNGENFEQLNDNNKDNIRIKDVVKEVCENVDSYPNLYDYLHVKGTKDLLDQNSIKHLTGLYKHEHSKNLFTPHAYLRFIERVVLPEFIDEDGFVEANYIDKNKLGTKYKEKLKELKSSIKEIGTQQLEVSSYNADGSISAPKFKVGIGNPPDDKQYFVTINNSGRIHTIF